MQRFQREVVQGTAKQFVEAKLAERDERHRRAGESRYRVEPNIKDGKGGLRDLHTLHWLAKYLYGQGPSEGAVEATIFTADEQATFRRCETFLWTVRCHLHFLTGRAEERLTFDVQQAMAERLGYVERGGLRIRRALHEALLPGRQGRRRPHHHPVLGARDGAGQDVARARPAAQSLELAHAPPHPHHQRLPHRQRPAQRRRPRRLQARSRQPHPLLCQGRGDGCLLPSQRRAAAAPVAAPDRRQAAQRPGSQPHLPRDALLDEEPRADAAAHERSRRARPLHSRLRPRRVDDAVQHVPPLSRWTSI